MEFIDVGAIHEQSREEIESAIKRVLEHRRFINGPEVKTLESTLSKFCNVDECVAVSSGTMALEVALRALEIGPGDEVITTPFTWISTAETIALVGARPVFADIDPDTFNIQPKQVLAAVTEKTKAIIAVDLFGQMADYEAIEAIAREHGLYVIQDAAQSFGAEHNGCRSCSFGDIACTSFFPAKPFGCYGDGGALFTSDPQFAPKIRAIVNHGGVRRGNHTLVGTNGRCDTLQAAILLAKFPAFKNEIKLRAEVGQRYSKGLARCCQIPSVAYGNTHVYAQYTLRVEDRDAVSQSLKAQGIPTAVYYAQCLHEQPVFSNLNYQMGDFPVAEKASKEVLSIPMHPYFKKADQQKVIDSLRHLYEG